MDVKSLYVSGQHEAFLSEFMEFMKEPITRFYDILKIDLFLDVKKLVHRYAYPGVAALSEQIDRYLETHLRAGQFLKKDISANNLIYLEK
jgi:hypothetical protein